MFRGSIWVGSATWPRETKENLKWRSVNGVSRNTEAIDGGSGFAAPSHKDDRHNHQKSLALREVAEDERDASLEGVNGDAPHKPLREILQAFPKPEPQCLLQEEGLVMAAHDYDNPATQAEKREQFSGTRI